MDSAAQAHTKLPDRNLMLYEGLLGAHDWSARIAGDQARMSAAAADMKTIEEVGKSLPAITAKTIMFRHEPDRSLVGQNGYPRHPKGSAETDRFHTAFANQRIAQRKALGAVGEFLIEASAAIEDPRTRYSARSMGKLLAAEYSLTGAHQFDNRSANQRGEQASEMLRHVAVALGPDTKNGEGAIMAAGYLLALSKAGREMDEVASRQNAKAVIQAPLRGEKIAAR